MRIARGTSCIALVGILLALGAADARAEKVLRWKFKEGDALHFITKMNMAQSLTVMGMAQKSNVDQTTAVTWVVTSVDADGTAEMAQRVDRIKMKISGGPIAATIDTNGPEPMDQMGKLISPLFKAMVKHPLTLRMSAQGVISDVVLPEGLKEAMQSDPALAQVGSMFSEVNLKQMNGAGVLKLPEEAVTGGSTWDQEVNIGAQQTVKTTYTFEATEQRNGRDLEKIATKIEATLPSITNAESKIEVKDHSGTGVIYFDNESGQLVESYYKTTLTAEITVMGMVFPQTIETTSTMRRMPAPAQKAAETAPKP